MSVLLANNCIAIVGDCGVEEAETLLALCQANRETPVDVSGAGVVHTALWQVMMVVSPPVMGLPADPFLRRWIMPVLTRPKPSRSAT
ncbi:MAG: hypothetical protein ACOH2M_06275 [Cypionkella sp.]